ncbi:MAG TPA: anti-sigma factor [Opitutaceae bacterium]|nr:anti-sigma factor [Opitutaceae bacterium]
MSEDDTTPLRPTAKGTPAPDGPAVPHPVLAWLPWIAAGAFALLAGFLAQAHFAARTEMIALREQAALSNIRDRSLQQQLEAERILAARRVADLLAEAQDPARLAGLQLVVLVAPADAPASGMAIAAWDPVGQEGRLAVANLPPPATDKDYQLWIFDPLYADPVNAGVLALPPAAGEARLRFKPDRPVTSATRFAVSLERKGGAPRAEGPTILASH